MQSMEPNQQIPVSDESASAPADRVNELEAQLKAAREEQLRLMAEMDNQRKRLARDVDSARKYGTERLLGDLLPVWDSLDMGLKAEAADAAKLREGMEMTLRILSKALESNGLVALDPVGEAFNPEWHQAMSVVETTNQAPGTVVTVFQRGYRLNDRLLRPAMVAVAKEPSA